MLAVIINLRVLPDIFWKDMGTAGVVDPVTPIQDPLGDIIVVNAPVINARLVLAMPRVVFIDTLQLSSKLGR